MSASRWTSYTGVNERLLSLAPALNPGDLVIDVGCSSGALGRELQKRCGARVIGVELDRQLAAMARDVLDEVLEADALSALETLSDRAVDAKLVIFADVLEHLVDPWSAVEIATRCVSSNGGGFLLASIPNVAHVDTIYHLLRGHWPMRERGIHDDTHLRFFARRDLPGLFAAPGATMDRLESVYRIVEHSHWMNRLAPLAGRIWPNGFTFQFQVLVRVDGDSPASRGAFWRGKSLNV